MSKVTLVPDKIKFSYQIARGSVNSRIHKTEDIINQTYDEIIKSGVSETVSINFLKDLIKKVLPEKKRVDIVNIINKNTCGGEDFLSSNSKFKSNENLIGYRIDMPLINDKLSISNLSIFIHEFTHVLDSLFNPKTSSRLIKCENMLNNIHPHCQHMKSFSDKYDDCYQNSLYVREKFSCVEEIPNIINKRRDEVLKLLKNRKPEEKIMILQNYRYYLETENNAYRNERMIFGRLIEDNRNYNKDLLETSDDSQYLFNEKIQMLKELCFEEIQNFRQKSVKKKGS